LSIATTDGHVPVDGADLGLPDSLVSQVSEWCRDWRSVLASGGFASTTDAERFAETGRQLATSLQGSLGQHWNIEYYPELIRPPGLQLRIT